MIETKEMRYGKEIPAFMFSHHNRKRDLDSLRFAAPYAAVIGDANKVDSIKNRGVSGLPCRDEYMR